MKVEFECGMCMIKYINKGYELTTWGYEEDGMHQLEPKVGVECVLVATIDSNILENLRCGHSKLFNLTLLHKLNMVHGFPQKRKLQNFKKLIFLTSKCFPTRKMLYMKLLME
jgi:hypothetical protein